MIFEKGNKITTNNRNCFVIKNAENGYIFHKNYIDYLKIATGILSSEIKDGYLVPNFEKFIVEL